MPPHCDSMDGPVVTAAKQALEADDVELVLPYVHEDGEDEVRCTFDEVKRARADEDARDVADRLFYETVVRVHRAGEGAPYTGLKPAGVDVGPALPRAERAVAAGDSTEVREFLVELLRKELDERMSDLRRLEEVKGRSLADNRRYTEAMLGFEVFSQRLYKAITAPSQH